MYRNIRCEIFFVFMGFIGWEPLFPDISCTLWKVGRPQWESDAHKIMGPTEGKIGIAIRSCSMWAKVGVMPSINWGPRKVKNYWDSFPTRGECGVPLVATIILLLFMIQASVNVDALVPSFLSSLAAVCGVMPKFSLPSLDIALGHSGGP